MKRKIEESNDKEVSDKLPVDNNNVYFYLNPQSVLAKFPSIPDNHLIPDSLYSDE